MIRRLGDISATIDYGVTASAVESPVGPKFLRITDIQDGVVDWDTVPWCSCSEREAQSCQLQDGDIVFARTGATTGKSFLIRQAPRQSVFASYLIRVRLGKDANPVYVSHFFNSPDYWRQITGRARGVAQPGVNSTSLKTLEIPLPPLTEQKRIAGILDAADALRAKRRAALAQLDSLLQATFLDLFGDPVTNPKRWPVNRLESNISSVRYGTGSPPTYVEEGVPFIRATNVKSGTISSKGLMRISRDDAARIDKCRVQTGDLIIVRSGVNTGDCAFVPGEYDGAYAAFDLIVELPRANAVFYNFLINSPYGRAHLEPLTRRAAQPHLNAEQVRSLEFISPDRQVKERFVAIVELAEQQKFRLRATSPNSTPSSPRSNPVRSEENSRGTRMPVSISANFAFLAQEFLPTAESATLAERSINGDPRASCFHARHTLEQLVKRVYRLDKRLAPPRVQNLDGYMNEPTFLQVVGQTIWQKAEYVRKAGNNAVHGNKAPEPAAALDVMRELYHVLYWAGRTYLRKGAEKLEGVAYDESVIPPAEAGPVAPIEKLEAITKQRDEAEEKRRELETQVEELQQRVAAIRAENEKVPDTHDYDEATTRKRIIDLELQRAGWALGQPRDREYEVTGMPKRSGEVSENGKGYVDYVLWGDDGKPLAVVEAKRTIADPRRGQQQAKLYADCLENVHDQRPLIYYTNGYTTWLWDDLMYPPREVAGFSKKDELDTLIRRREQRKPLDVAKVKDAIVERYYQKRAIGSIAQHFASGHRKSLLVMATGTGKTRTAVALVDLLQRAGWAKRALFLADRVALVRQAVNAFKLHLPESSPVNLVTEKDKSGRVYVCTYPTMMGLIDETRPGASGFEARFGVGHFDLVIIDEAHRSVYQKFGAIFRYFDSLLVGLTATPREQVDRNTYQLFDLQPGVPTDAYELDTAVSDGFLVPPRAIQVNLKFPGRGIVYDDLSEAEKEEWESTDWGDDSPTPTVPARVEPQAINNWLFNANTVDQALKYLMQHGNKVEGGDRLAKTIIFARNHEHALFIEQRFNHHYPQHAGKFARVIDHYATYALSLIDDFSQKEKDPHIAISVDMLDTGIDVPEVANLVFFKPVYSKIKFWQMIGRGTRLCPDLFGPGMDKKDFRIFDFCYNFDFFKINPDGIERGGGMPLGARLFRSRVELVGHTLKTPALDPQDKVRTPTTNLLHAEVAAMNAENFIVRMHLQAVQKYQDRKAWDALSDDDRETLQEEVAGLPSEIPAEEIESRLFDLMSLRMQLATVEHDTSGFEKDRKKVVEIAMLLEEKSAIPAVKSQLGYLQAMQETEFWVGIDIAGLEEMRLRLRELVPLLDKTKRHIVFTDFEDEITGVNEDGIIDIPKMTGLEYQRKVEQYLQSHLNNIVIHRLRTNQPLTASDLQELEKMLVKVGEEDGEALLKGLIAQSKAPSLVHFVRGLVGMDRSAAQAAFSKLLSNQSLTPPQIRFVEMIIEQLTARGVIEPGALYEAPFTGLHAGGPDGLFAGRNEMIVGIFQAIEATRPVVQSSAG